uniref:Uncharacterized protein n=1 Tax=Anguilla anguilla TaxID=7936 RepID=A0A0E9RZN0_ANGAN
MYVRTHTHTHTYAGTFSSITFAEGWDTYLVVARFFLFSFYFLQRNKCS